MPTPTFHEFVMDTHIQSYINLPINGQRVHVPRVRSPLFADSVVGVFVEHRPVRREIGESRQLDRVCLHHRRPGWLHHAGGLDLNNRAPAPAAAHCLFLAASISTRPLEFFLLAALL